jgi:outer membrane protein assembly factor BamD (BamD/ComL family)
MRLLRTLLAVSLVSAPASAQDDFSFEIVEDKATDTDKQKFEDAKTALGEERYDVALGLLAEIIADPKQKKVHEEASYTLAKGLYRMGAYHAALQRFQPILEDGAKNKYYGSSREWLFFIARKVKDELAPLDFVVKYAKPEDIPADQASELNYALGRYWFLKALEAGAQGVQIEQEEQPEKPAEEGAAEGEEEGGFDFGAGENEEKKEEPKKDEKKEEGGFDFSSDPGGGDDEGFDFSDAADEAKKGKKGKKGKKAGKPKAEPKLAPTTTESPGVAADSGIDDNAKKKSENPKSAEDLLKLSLVHLTKVKPEFALYAKAVYLKGLAHFGLGDFDPAVSAFRGVVRMTNAKPPAQPDPSLPHQPNAKLREMAFFSLARIHYQFQQFRYAIFYYDRIDRDSEAWLDAIFESSWAHFRLAEYEKALGNLVTIQAPFFADEYYPEQSILQAITFYENCRYPEARSFVDRFKGDYDGVVKELERLVGQKRTPEQLYEELTALQKTVEEGGDDKAGSFKITARLIRLGLSDKRVASIRDAITEVDEETARLQAMAPPFGGSQVQQDLIAGVAKRRSELVDAAGRLLDQKLKQELAFLKDLQAKLIRITFEITKQEKESLEESLRNQSRAVPIEDYRDITATDDERQYWPFEGEYWRDELGTYQYTLTKGCRPPSEGE